MEQECFEIGQNNSESIQQKDVLVVRDGKQYIVRVAHPDYVEMIKKENLGKPEEFKLDESFFPLEDISSIGNICEYLDQLSDEELAPFEQVS